MGTTTIKLDELARDELQEYKNKHGMTYNGAVFRLLEIEEMVAEERDDEETVTNQTESSITTSEDDSYVELPQPQGTFREGADGASEFITRVIGGLMAGAGEYGSTANYAVWRLYAQMDIEPRIAERTNDPAPPNLDNLIEYLSDMIENPAEYTLTGNEWETDHTMEQAKRIQRALLIYQKIMGEDEIPLESENAPDLSVPQNRTYQGKQNDGVNIVTADGEKLDPRPDLNGGISSFSWGYGGRGPTVLAVALLADAYGSDRYARARGTDLKSNLTSSLPMGKSWEIRAEELDQYLPDH